MGCPRLTATIMRYKRDTRKKKFIDALTEQGTVYHAAQAAGSRARQFIAGEMKILSLRIFGMKQSRMLLIELKT
jgi:hypothetical protein